jgi:hypothetical protein
MNINRYCAFHLVFEAPRIDDLLSGLCDLLAQQDRERLRRALPWEPERSLSRLDSKNRVRTLHVGIRGIRQPEVDGREGAYSFVLRLPPANELHRLPAGSAWAERLVLEGAGHCLDLGGFQTTVETGDEWGHLRLLSKDAEMSLYLFNSPDLQDATARAMKGCCEAVLFESVVFQQFRTSLGREVESWGTAELTLVFPWRKNLDQTLAHPETVNYHSRDGKAVAFELGPDIDRYGASVRAWLDARAPWRRRERDSRLD